MHAIIIGNGVSGITAARHLRKQDSNCTITVVSAETDYFFSRTALMYIYMGHMGFNQTKPYENDFWIKNRINLIRGRVSAIDFSDQVLHFTEEDFNSIHGPAPDTLHYDKLVLALGSSSNKFGWPGQDLKGVSGLYSYQDLEMMEEFSPDINNAVIVGGGLIGIEMAEMFHSRHIPVTLLVRESSYWNNVLPDEESAMINRHIIEHGIDLRLEEELKEIHGDDKGKACGITTNKNNHISCEYVGLTAGVHPNVRWLKNSTLQIEKGILINNYCETNITNVYAIGDCAQLSDPQPGRRPIEAIWYTGRMMGEVVAYNITGKPVEYDPGIWFNSAKFLDIEYQVYGDVPAHAQKGLTSLYWEHSEGKKSIRINYYTDSNIIAGFNLMGIRYRHEVCRKWMEDKTDVTEVLNNLELAEFDPEFYPSFSSDIRKQYRNETGIQTEQKSKRSWNSVFNFLNK